MFDRLVTMGLGEIVKENGYCLPLQSCLSFHFTGYQAGGVVNTFKKDGSIYQKYPTENSEIPPKNNGKGDKTMKPENAYKFMFRDYPDVVKLFRKNGGDRE